MWNLLVRWRLPQNVVLLGSWNEIILNWIQNIIYTELLINEWCYCEVLMILNCSNSKWIACTYVCVYIYIHTYTHTQWASLVAQMVKNPLAVQDTWVWSLGWEDPLEENMATHSSILAWRIPMDRGAWWATVHGVTKSQIQLSTASAWLTIIFKH